MTVSPLPVTSPDSRRSRPSRLTLTVLDVVVPVFNEERVLAASVLRLHDYLSNRFPFSWRITIVDNASTDDTFAVATDLAAHLDGVVARRLDRKGRGYALRTAWLASDAAVVAYMDVDLSTDLDALLPLVAPLVSGHSDVAIGSRLAPGAAVARGPRRELISRSYNLILRTLFATQVRDAQCGFKALRGEVAQLLVPAVEDDAWFFDTELLLLAERNGLRIHQVPVDWVDDPDSRVHVARTAIDDLRGAGRMLRRFATGKGSLELGGVAREPLHDDFGRRLVTFGLIGAASTAVSLAIYALLRTTFGPFASNVVALSATFAANAWAHARYTQRARKPRWGRATIAYGVALGLSSVALVVSGATTLGVPAELVVLALAWSAAGIVRLRLLEPGMS
jgi:putative flippase GtrA